MKNKDFKFSTDRAEFLCRVFHFEKVRRDNLRAAFWRTCVEQPERVLARREAERKRAGGGGGGSGFDPLFGKSLPNRRRRKRK